LLKRLDAREERLLMLCERTVVAIEALVSQNDKRIKLTSNDNPIGKSTDTILIEENDKENTNDVHNKKTIDKIVD